MPAASASLWLSLLASAVLGFSAPPRPAPTLVPDPVCDPAWCRLSRPTAAELDAIVAEATRLLHTYADDHTPLGQQCFELGATMSARAADVRMIEFMWRAPDLRGNLAAVTGDAHAVEAVPGTGLVHIARGFDALNPDRGIPAILQTARHEFAHLNGLAQTEGWEVDAAADVARACGPP